MFCVTTKFPLDRICCEVLKPPSSLWLSCQARRPCGPGGKAPLWEDQSKNPESSQTHTPKGIDTWERMAEFFAWWGPQRKGEGNRIKEKGSSNRK